MSFLMMEALERVQKSPLLKVHQVIDWPRLSYVLGNLERSGYGPQGYEPIQLFKGLLLQAWHSLSDPGLEEALKVRLDFMVFTGFEGSVPDETTFCRFRGLLTQKGLWKKLLWEINKQLQHQGLQVSPSQGAILDATIIESAARPNKEIEGVVVDREEEEVTVVLGQESLSADPDATWLKKGRKSYFGYKGFMVTDSIQGAIHEVHVTPAHVSEVKTLEPPLGELTPRRLYADKGYASAENRDRLKSKGIRNGIMYKAAKNKPLTLWEKRANKIISKSRYLVEQGFGTLKRRFEFARASYFTTEKVEAQMVVKAIAFNLLKAIRQPSCV